MSTPIWIAVAVALLFAVGYFLAMRNVYRKSRELDKHIDYRKIRRGPDPADDAD